MSHSNERGIALLTTLLIMMLVSAILVAFTTVIMSDQRYRFIDKDRGQAFYGAEAGIEKLTADLGTLFLQNVAPTNAQVTALTTTAMQPVLTIPGQSSAAVTYTSAVAPAPLPASEMTSVHCYNTAAQAGPPPVAAVTRAAVTVGGNGYAISFCADTSTNNPTTLADAKTITQGTYAGLYALKTPYQIDVTAKTPMGGEVHLVRTMETVSIPVFQFGIFSDVDLGFHAGDDFNFGGRVHTNGNLFLEEWTGKTLTLSDRVTAYKDVIRTTMMNGNAIENNTGLGNVSITKGSGTFRNLQETEGSLIGGVGSSPNAAFNNISTVQYLGWLKNGANGNKQYSTGAKQLTLPIVAPGVGGTNVDIIRRPLAGEATTSILYQERLFNKASIRVLLSDTVADIMNIPGVDASVQPSSLEAGNSYPSAANAFAQPIPIATTPGAAPLATVSSTSGSNPNVVITLTAALPAYMVLPSAGTQFTVTKSASTWNITGCNEKTPTQFKGCTAIGSTIPSGATASITWSNSPNAGDPTWTASSPITGSIASGSTAITMTSTLALTPNTFWVDDWVVTCTGYQTTTKQLNGCTVNNPAGISNGEKIQNFSIAPANTSVLGGYIKVERLNASDRTWHDITPEMLNYGIAAPAEYGSCQGDDPSPNAILRLQRLPDDALTASANCVAGNSAIANSLRTAIATDYWPPTLFDSRESWNRGGGTPPVGVNIKPAGVMHYVAIDVGNLAKWFAGTAPYTVAAGSTGTLSMPDNTGYSIYISDRRNNVNAAGAETAELGYEDFVNPLSSTGAPNGVLDAGEDVNANGQLDTYGRYPSCGGTYNYTIGNAVGGVTCASSAQQFTTPWPPDLSKQPDFVSSAGANIDLATVDGVGRAMVNRALFFRRAVKVMNAATIAPTINGFTVVSENPVYMDGDWNANGGWTNPHAATSIIADALTILSNSWTDRNSYLNPYNVTTRVGGGKVRPNDSWYRVAILAGKGAPFPYPTGEPGDFGTDGGVHNFLRMLEDTQGGDTVHYQGSLATLFYNRQGVGTYKASNLAYGVPHKRDFLFDTDFLSPALLPPLTPMFRDNNAVGFSQQLQPGK